VKKLLDPGRGRTRIHMKYGMKVKCCSPVEQVKNRSRVYHLGLPLTQRLSRSCLSVIGPVRARLKYPTFVSGYTEQRVHGIRSQEPTSHGIEPGQRSITCGHGGPPGEASAHPG